MKRSNTRLLILFLFFICIALCLALRLFYLQIISGRKFVELARQQHTNLVKTEHERGNILDKKRVVLATNIPTYSVYADPGRIKDKLETARELSKALDLGEGRMLERVSRDKSFVWLKRKLSRKDKTLLEEKNIRGVGFLREYRRFYPQEKLAAHLLGLVDIDNNGLDGLELKYNKYLTSASGEALVVRDSKGKNLPLYHSLKLGNDGYTVELNIDAHIQYWADEYLREAVTGSKAEGGSVVIMNPKDGSILALANYPVFDPNNVSVSDQDSFRNRAVTDYYEPGSVFKILTLIAALEQVDGIENMKFDCQMGEYKIPGSILHDWKSFGTLSFEEVFMNSSNIGVAKIVQLVGAKKYSSYIKKFGFGQATGVDLPYETPGYVKEYKDWSKTSQYIIPMGQEVAVSVIQLARMLSVAVNGGYMVTPFIVNKITDKKGVVIKRFEPQIKGPVISSLASKRTREILGRVVSEGTGRRARVEGVTVGGKTGTAQKINPKGGYSKKDFYVTFAGFFPVEDPEYVIVVNIDEPHGQYHSGGMVAAPLFQKIADSIADYAHLRN